MRVTNSRDGIRRTTVRTEHRLDRTDFVNILCMAAARGLVGDDPDELPEKMSRTAILDIIKTQLRSGGNEAHDYWSDDVDEGRTDEIREWATSLIEAKFPEFDQ